MSGKLLIVDGEKNIIDMLKNYFQILGDQVYTAYNGIEVLRKVICQPDIILLVSNIPELTITL